MTKTLIQAIASEVSRYRCVSAGDSTREAVASSLDSLDTLADMLPSGSGIDCGTKIDLENSTETCVVLALDYHHMDDNGFYCGWSSHQITITPAFDGTALDIECTSNDADLTCVDEDGNEFDDSEFAIDSLHDYLADTYRYHVERVQVSSVYADGQFQYSQA